jgi:hypothetical protein
LGIDFHVGATLLLRVWSTLAGGITLLGIPKWLGSVEQGYYFTFSSVLALQIFFELGFSFVVQQIVGHEMSSLSWDARGALKGPATSLSRVSSLIKLLGKWYLIMAILFLGVVGVAGQTFFNAAGREDVSNWKIAWWILVIATSLNLFASPFLAVIEGAGRVGQVARLRLFQSITGYILLWVALSKGAGLLATPIASVIGAAGSGLWLYLFARPVLRLWRGAEIIPGSEIRWRRDVLPFQWRIAVSWTSGYFLFQLFNPMIFAVSGAKLAGRYGLALTVFSSILSLSMSWVTAKTPSMATLVAQGRRVELERLFWSLWKHSGVLNITASIVVIGACYWLEQVGHPLAMRIAPLPVLIAIAVNNTANHTVFAMATYMRAHREEPMLPVSVVGALLTACAAWLSVSHGLLALAASCAGVNVLVGLPWTIALFQRYRKGWEPRAILPDRI